ncbi:MAG: hypothetical protein ACK4SX_11980 [Alcanivoracaceae bacterium]
MVRYLALIVALLSPPTLAANLCAFPGRDGDALAEGVINLWQAGADGSVVEAGSRWLPLARARRGRGEFASGDLALLLQMQGATLAASNTPSYGDGSGSGWEALAAGHFELVRIEELDGERVRVRADGSNGGIRHRYISREPNADADAGRQSWQLVRVPQYENLTLGGDLRALPWDGRTGGVLALDVRYALDLAGHRLRADGAGFRGGAALSLVGALGSEDDYRYRAPGVAELAAAFGQHASKGEGLAGTPRWVAGESLAVDTRPEADRLTISDGYPFGSMARGAPANAGGGGNSLSLDNLTASGGGGGGGGEAGRPGYDRQGAAAGGLGGAAVPVELVRLIPGGGGGAGTRHHGLGLEGSGGAGGGVVLIRAGRLVGEGEIDLRGHTGVEAAAAGGGGGGAGTLLLQVPFVDGQPRRLHLDGGAAGAGQAIGGQGGAGRLLQSDNHLWLGVAEGRSGLIQSGDVAGVLPGYLCRPSGMLLAGQVFEDNGRDDGIAHDGIHQRGEAGLEGRAVRIRDGSRVIADTATNRFGRFMLELPESVADRSLVLEIDIPEGWMPVAANANDLPLAPFSWQGQGRWRFTARREYLQDGIALGLIRLPRWDAPQARDISPGSTQLFLFRYLPETSGRVRFRYRGELSGASGWRHRFLLDPECSDASRFLDQGVSRWLPLTPGQPVCVRVRVDVPADAPQRGHLSLWLEAETDLGNTPLKLQLPPLQSRIEVRLAP